MISGLTVRKAALLGTPPGAKRFASRAWNWLPLSATVVVGRNSARLVAPGISTPFLNHCTDTGPRFDTSMAGGALSFRYHYVGRLAGNLRADQFDVEAVVRDRLLDRSVRQLPAHGEVIPALSFNMQRFDVVAPSLLEPDRLRALV